MNPWGFIGTYREQVSYSICEKHAYIYIYIHENRQRKSTTLRFIQLRTGSAPGFVQRITCLAGNTRTKGWLPGAPGNRASWVELTKMFDIPGITQWKAIFGLQTDSARPGDSHYPIRAFPPRRQLV